MSSMSRLASLASCALAMACAIAGNPKMNAEVVNNYGYHPVDPLPVQAKKVSGTLIVQTLGVSGSGISGLLPMRARSAPRAYRTPGGPALPLRI